MLAIYPWNMSQCGAGNTALVCFETMKPSFPIQMVSHQTGHHSVNKLVLIFFEMYNVILLEINIIKVGFLL